MAPLLLKAHLKYYIKSMPKLHLQRLSLKNLARQLYVQMEVQQKEDQIIAAICQEPILTDLSVNTLYCIIKHKPQSIRAEILVDIDFLGKVASWLHREVISGLERLLTHRSHQQLVELIHIIITAAADYPHITGNILLISQKILKCFYNIVESSDDPLLRGAYLDCISKIFRVRPDVFNIGIYAEMLSQTEEKVDEFYEFLDFYLLQTQNHDAETVGFVLDGFSCRMKVFSKRPTLAKIERRGIINAYSKLIAFIKNQIPTALPEKILNEHPEIFEYLHNFESREFSHNDLSKVFNNLIAVYMNSKVSNVYKFEFVLNTFKRILLKSHSLFSFLKTDILQREDFLKWFVSTELQMDKGKQVLECYLKNSSSLEFLMVITVLYIHCFSNKAEEVAHFMRQIGLLEEAKCYLHKNSVKEYFEMYYDLIREREFFDEFINRIEDRSDLMIL